MKADKIKKMISWAFFLFYMIALSYFLFFSEKYGRVTGTEEYRYNLIPLNEIKRFIKYHKILGYRSLIINIVGNILAFAPFGFFMPIVSPQDNKAWRVVVTGCCFSLLIEMLQLVFKIGIFDIDDILLNTIGVAIGYIGFRIAAQIIGRIVCHEKKERRV